MKGSIVVLGVSGSGKTTIGKLLAQKLNLSFFDADDFHPPSNISKMAQGVPLNDQDRQPWLLLLSQKLAGWHREGGAVLACSALKEEYRKLLGKNSPVQWIYLEIDEAHVAERFRKRTDHFMPASLVRSQFDALEPPEYGIRVDASQPPDLIIRDILNNLRSSEPSHSD